MSGDLRCGHIGSSLTHHRNTYFLSPNPYSCPCEGQESQGRHEISALWQVTMVLPPYSSPLLFPLPSRKAISVINDNLQSHTFSCPFSNQIVAIVCQPPNSNLSYGQEKNRSMWLKYWLGAGFHVEHLALM